MTIWTIHRKGLPALHIFRWKIEQLYLQICGFIREDRYADPYGTKKRTFSLRLFRFAGHFSNRMVYHAGYSDVRKDPMQIILGLLIKIRACFLQMKRIGNISQRKFLWTILKRNARRTIILPVNTFKAFIRIGEVTSPIRAEILKAVSLQQICCHVLYLLLLT